MSEINDIDRSARNRQIGEREEACNSAQIALAQRACKAAERVADAASRQATAAERALEGQYCARNRDNFHDGYRVQYLDDPRYFCSSRIQLDDEAPDEAIDRRRKR